MQIIPAIDIIEGKCVRLTQGDYSQKKIYCEDPLEVAKQFEDSGLTRLHLVDLDGARSGEVKNWKVLETIATRTAMIIDFSGGIRSTESVEISIRSGAFYIALGSIAVEKEDIVRSWIQFFGSRRFIICADVKGENVVINGWAKKVDIPFFGLIDNYHKHGIKQFLCTDVSKDGLLQGPSIELYEKVLMRFPAIHLLASGGISTANDLKELKQIGCGGAIIGKAIYENKIELNELKSGWFKDLRSFR